MYVCVCVCVVVCVFVCVCLCVYLSHQCAHASCTSVHTRHVFRVLIARGCVRGRACTCANVCVGCASRLLGQISDFGLSRVKAFTVTMTGQTGTYQWMAPEVLNNERYTEKADGMGWRA